MITSLIVMVMFKTWRGQLRNFQSADRIWLTHMTHRRLNYWRSKSISLFVTISCIMYHVPNLMFVAIFSNVHFSILGRTLHTAPFQTSPSTKRLARVSSGETMLFDIGNLCWWSFCYQCCVVLMIILFPVLSIGQRLPMMEGRWRSRKSRSLRWWIARFPLQQDLRFSHFYS